MNKKNDFYQVSLKLLLKNKTGRILGLKSREDGINAGFYDLPGGRITKDEFLTSFLKIMRREVKEETGNMRFNINPTPVAVARTQRERPRDKEHHYLLLFFESSYLGGKIKISKEHTGYAWLNVSNRNAAKFFTKGNLEGIKMYLNQNDKTP